MLARGEDPDENGKVLEVRARVTGRRQSKLSNFAFDVRRALEVPLRSDASSEHGIVCEDVEARHRIRRCYLGRRRAWWELEWKLARLLRRGERRKRQHREHSVEEAFHGTPDARHGTPPPTNERWQRRTRGA